MSPVPAMKVDDKINTGRANWSFGGNIPDNFVSHIKRSVPLYEEGHDLICQLSDFFVLPDSTVYELGVSTGELIRKLADYNKDKPNVQWIGLEREENMVDKAREHCADMDNVQIMNDDILLYDYQQADMIVSYYTIQFVPERNRQQLFNKIYESLNWGGAFVLFEKVRAPDARFNDIMTSLYRNFKKEKGFTADEIYNKEDSLKGVLKPFSTEGNLGLLQRAGFTDIMTVMKYVCFEGFLAIK
jgi:tRNA (cmo5U34)-methyltransferase